MPKTSEGGGRRGAASQPQAGGGAGVPPVQPRTDVELSRDDVMGVIQEMTFEEYPVSGVVPMESILRGLAEKYGEAAARSERAREAIRGLINDRQLREDRGKIQIPDEKRKTFDRPGDRAPDKSVLAETKKLESKSVGGLVSIPELRERIRRSHGEKAASHAALDGQIYALWRSGAIRILPLNDARGTTVESRDAAIKGSQDTWYYIEVAKSGD